MKGVLVVLLLSLLLPHTTSKAEVVETKEVYTYETLLADIAELSQLYPNLISYQSLATTTYGRKIWAIKLGNGDIPILMNGAHHAREWMTSSLLMKMIEAYADAYKTRKTIGQFDPDILDNVSIWFVPMVNPDGVSLQQLGLYAFPSYIHQDLIAMNRNSTNFNRWKANIHGMDLNRQYPANWKALKGVSKKPHYQFYKGTRPLQALEVQSLVDFTYEIKPEIAVAYHSSGSVIFWGFNQWSLTHTTKAATDYYVIAEQLSEITNYKIKKPAPFQQGGGYTDWFVEEFNKPGITIEIGSWIKESSVPLDEFPEIWNRNKEVGLFLAEKAYERKKRCNKQKPKKWGQTPPLDPAIFGFH